jgi:hypothetical protein
MEFKLMTPNEVTRSRRPGLRQGNAGGRRRDAPRVALLRRVLRVRSLAKQFGLPLCDRDRLKAMPDGELHAYFDNLHDRIKRHVMSLAPTIAQRLIERLDQLRAHRQECNARLRRSDRSRMRGGCRFIPR